MADRPDKKNRKASLAAWKAQQRATARAKLPLPIEQMEALFDYLAAYARTSHDAYIVLKAT
jgi:hypothetical protein